MLIIYLEKRSLTSPIDQILFVWILFQRVELIRFADVCSEMNILSVACNLTLRKVLPSQVRSLTPFAQYDICWLARQHTIIVNGGKIQNFVTCNTQSLRNRALSGIVETTVVRKSHGWHMIRDPHLTLHLRIARCKTLSLSRCSWRCHKTSCMFSIILSSLLICFCNHSLRSRTERELRFLSTWEFYHDLTHRRLSKLPTTACWFRKNVGKGSKPAIKSRPFNSRGGGGGVDFEKKKSCKRVLEEKNSCTNASKKKKMLQSYFIIPGGLYKTPAKLPPFRITCKPANHSG